LLKPDIIILPRQGTIFTVLGVALAIYFYFAGARTRRLTYYVNPIKTIVVKGGEASTLRVLHDGQDIKGDVTAAQVAIWNDGTEPIRAENILSSVRLVLEPAVPILEAKIRKESRDVIGATVDTSHLADGVIPVAWKILEHNDGAVIELIFEGSAETELVVQGTVEGQPTVLGVKPPYRIQSPAEQVAWGRRSALRLAVISGGSAVFLLVTWLLRRGLRGSPARDGRGSFLKFVANILLILLFLSFYILWREFRQPGPPFGF
jgi:hypothetical protein